MTIMTGSTSETRGTQRGTRRAVLRAAGLGTGVAAGVALAACSAPSATSGPGAGDGEAPSRSSAPVSVRLIERLDQESQALDARLPVFRTQFPNITVEREAVPGAELIPKLQTMAAADTMPDNVHAFTGGQEYHNFVLGGAFRNIDGLLARDKVDLKGWFPELVEIMKVDGKLYGLPFKGQVLAAGFYYNVSLFETRGVGLPTETWTLDDLVKAALQLTDPPGERDDAVGLRRQLLGGRGLHGAPAPVQRGQPLQGRQEGGDGHPGDAGGPAVVRGDVQPGADPAPHRGGVRRLPGRHRWP